MSTESNKWLLKLNEINKEIWDYANEVGYDPQEVIDSEEEVDEGTAAELAEYKDILKRKKVIEKKLEQVL